MIGYPRLQSASAHDEPFLYSLFATVKRESMIGLTLEPEQLDMLLQMQWKARSHSYALQYPESASNVIYSSEAIPAGGCITELTTERLSIVDLAIFPEHRNGGIGAFVIKHMQDTAARHCVSVLLSVDRSNPALRLYERMGFYITGSNDFQYSMRWDPENQ
ncbi:GNAT family N-acetyltransferase [Paenibacillus sp. GCM10027627]|uniref:GNAT family N-acetyltransferase n=1 Tax=unclassified Paenibacillus TaxID=185978 RepID=UPI00362AFAFD